MGGIGFATDSLYVWVCRGLEQALLTQDAAIDRSTDKMGMLRRDLR
jgi:predicted nucleic acid-binding protein